jgi:hypothetical protein
LKFRYYPDAAAETGQQMPLAGFFPVLVGGSLLLASASGFSAFATELLASFKVLGGAVCNISHFAQV